MLAIVKPELRRFLFYLQQSPSSLSTLLFLLFFYPSSVNLSVRYQENSERTVQQQRGTTREARATGRFESDFREMATTGFG